MPILKLRWKSSEQEPRDKDGLTPLSRAAWEGNEVVMKRLLDMGAKVESKDEKQDRTPLSFAALGGHEAAVRLLLDIGAKIEAKDNCRRTPLSWAAAGGGVATVHLLLTRGADIESKDAKQGRTPLSFAAMRGNKGVVQLLLQKGAKIESKDNNGQTPLSWAAWGGDVATIQVLLAQGADIESKDAKQGRTPLSFAALGGQEGAVRLLLDKGAQIAAKDKNGHTPAWWASQGGHEVISILLSRGSQVESGGNKGLVIKAGSDPAITAGAYDGHTLLSRAAWEGNDATVRQLLDRGADIESKDEKQGRTPLSFAAFGGHERVMQILLDQGAEIEARDNDGSTPLIWAAFGGNSVIVQLLLDRGAGIESKDKKQGRTPLSFAALGGRERVVRLLLDQGAEVEARDNDGRTPLWWAGRWVGPEGYDVVRLLLDSGADIESKDNNNRTPLSSAALLGHDTIVRLLLNRGAKIESKDNNSQTPLSWAAWGGNESAVRQLLDRGADIESKDEKQGRTPLSFAAFGGHKRVVRILLDQGAEIGSIDYAGKTPLWWASWGGHTAVVQLLSQSPSSVSATMTQRIPRLLAVEKRDMSKSSASSVSHSRNDCHFAIICALALEFDAVYDSFDEIWDGQDGDFGKTIGDPNQYITGRMGKLPVVLVLLPGMGKANAASATASLRSSYNNLRMALVVGVCGAIPTHFNGTEIILGDVIVSKYVVQYDFGRRYANEFKPKTAIEDTLGRPNKETRILTAMLDTRSLRDELQDNAQKLVQKLQAKVRNTQHRDIYNYLGTPHDRLFDPKYRHKHRGTIACDICDTCLTTTDPVCERTSESTCTDLCCGNKHLVHRVRLMACQRQEQEQVGLVRIPSLVVHTGGVGSADTVMKSGEMRDAIAKRDKVIAFEMEGAGVWDELPCLLIKGVCDYADSHKSKGWQNYAAATAASTAKAILGRFFEDGLRTVPNQH